MWGPGGRFYWRRREEPTAGIVVVFAWLSSQERHVNPYIELYASHGWSSLVCHSEFLTLFTPQKATSLACSVLNELVKEVKIRPLPIIFAPFSGGPKGCMYKVLQLIEGKCEGPLSLEEYRLVKDCLCGQIYDSTPVDFTSDLGTRFVLHPSVTKMAHPPRVLSWMTKAVASGLDTLFINRFEEQRADYWQTLYNSVSVGPFLILCSEDDELAPYSVICSFAQRLQELGGDVKLVKWNNSPHVGHYKHHPVDYKAAVTELLDKAATVYARRRKSNEQATGTTNACETLKSVWKLHKAAGSSNESLRRVAISPSDHFFLPSSMEYEGTKGAVSVQDEHKGELIHVQSPPTINPHGVLGQILFDVCVPKNVEGWDIKPVSDSSHTFTAFRRQKPLNPIKCIRRSRL